MSKILNALSILEEHHFHHHSDLSKAFSSSAQIQTARDEVGEEEILIALSAYYLTEDHFTRSTIRLKSKNNKVEWINLLRAIAFEKKIRFIPDPHTTPTFAKTNAKLKAKMLLHQFYKNLTATDIRTATGLNTDKLIEMLIQKATEAKDDVTDIPIKEKIGRDIDIYPEDQTKIIEYVKSLDKKTANVLNHYYRFYAPLVSIPTLEKLLGNVINIAKEKERIKDEGIKLIADFLFQNEKQLGPYYQINKENEQTIASYKIKLDEEQLQSLVKPIKSFLLKGRLKKLLRPKNLFYLGDAALKRRSWYIEQKWGEGTIKELEDILASERLTFGMAFSPDICGQLEKLPR